VLSARVVTSGHEQHIDDILVDEHYDHNHAAIGHRRMFGVPMLRDGKPIGAIVVAWREPGITPQAQTDLLATFAAQAVIAIENVRLFTELREALDQQTATAEILQVISQSPTDVAPVLQAVAKAAVRFCGSDDMAVGLRDGDSWYSAAHVGPFSSDTGRRFPLVRDSMMGRVMIDGKTLHVPDVTQLDRVEFVGAHDFAARHGFRAALIVPMIREGAVIGALNMRRLTPGPFTPRQIELLEAFAAQAVIAIENVRLFTELREALEQQTATAEILRVISQSPTDVSPVLAAVAKAALKFCGAQDAAVSLLDGDNWFIAAHEGPIEALPGPRPLNRYTAPGRAMIDGKVVQIADLRSGEGEEFPDGRELGARMGFRSALAAPLLRDDVPIGAISLRRPEPGAFTPNQVELLKSFAAQAVIAIENVRLFTELRDSLERLKAAQANLIQSEKMASLGQLTAGIAHEIKNPLNFVNNFAGLSSELLEELKDGVDALLAAPDADKRAELHDTIELLNGNLAKILEHGRRADGIVKSMLAHSRGGTGDWQSSNINSLVEEALNLAYHGARAQDQSFNVTLERQLAERLKPIDVVPQDVTRVFLNLFSNGFYATRKRQRDGGDDGDDGYQPTLRVSTRDLGEAVEIRVRDNGTGITPEVRDKLFQPFFTTKPTGEGTGLGLSISYDIVTQQHGGTIGVESELGQYTEFTVRLPRARRVAE
jgi:signal transduction histidine kinase